MTFLPSGGLTPLEGPRRRLARSRLEADRPPRRKCASKATASGIISNWSTSKPTAPGVRLEGCAFAWPTACEGRLTSKTACRLPGRQPPPRSPRRPPPRSNIASPPRSNIARRLEADPAQTARASRPPRSKATLAGIRPGRPTTLGRAMLPAPTEATPRSRVSLEGPTPRGRPRSPARSSRTGQPRSRPLEDRPPRRATPRGASVLAELTARRPTAPGRLEAAPRKDRRPRKADRSS
jgi:hypothetical protein